MRVKSVHCFESLPILICQNSESRSILQKTHILAKNSMASFVCGSRNKSLLIMALRSQKHAIFHLTSTSTSSIYCMWACTSSLVDNTPHRAHSLTTRQYGWPVHNSSYTKISWYSLNKSRALFIPLVHIPQGFPAAKQTLAYQLILNM